MKRTRILVPGLAMLVVVGAALPAGAGVAWAVPGTAPYASRAVSAAITVPPGGSFFDDDGNIFEADIEAIAAVGVTRGCNAERTSFCPTRSVTRGQMAAFLVRALGFTDQDPAIGFTDDNDSIFENDIEKLATAGITKGCG
ncbi:MAG: hypothetical protein JJE47_15390, partial [Acidimicrobiia bacterium]|nr:hypothetical protein [Acidimicrobiia bacterium]